MLAIVDGGSTKADWKIRLAEGQIITITTTGFNPNYDSPAKISALINKELRGTAMHEKEGSLFYYGAGCWDPARQKIVAEAIQNVFPFVKIHIDHDLLGAARATAGDQPGIACILGTGSNSVLYDGKNEKDNVTNLGFLLGDEGSGANIGKRLVQAYFYREMPEEFHPIMLASCPNGKIDILNKVYGDGVPAAYLASFVRHFQEHRNHPWVKGILKDCFYEFLTRHVYKYTNYQKLPIHFVGSIAYHFSDILEACIEAKGLKMGVILQKPIHALFDFHMSHDLSVA